MSATATATLKKLPIPGHFDPKKVGDIRQIPYGALAADAIVWRKKHGIKPASSDRLKVSVMLIDMQNTFCVKSGELFVGGRSGNGAIEDSHRTCEFIYRNLPIITDVSCTLDTHRALQIFHPAFWVDSNGEHPAPFTMISVNDVETGIWKVDPAIAVTLGSNYASLQAHALHYVRELKKAGKFQLTIWPYHGMLGGVGHALVAAIEEACFFHGIARSTQVRYEIKGGNALTENYSILRPEVLTGPGGETIAQKNSAFMKALLEKDVVIIGGQAMSHCVSWTIDDLLTEILAKDPALAKKVYLLEDCTSPVVIPGIIDYTDEANASFKKFRDAGMHVVRSTDPIETWPEINL